ncbi:MAG: hypothetical protein IPK68_04895 [Bdellovibrionales bacterium]|nr:hypothetical protein [Bdellovibrionales bacterium]
MERSALQFAVQSGVSISKIVLYMAESVPLVLARRALGIGNRPDPGPSKNHRNILFSEILNMLKDDFTNISNQLYPPESLAAFSPIEHAKRYIWLVRDSVNAAKRAENQQYREFSKRAKVYLAGLPEYYRRNFHYQTDGYLSEESAELYGYLLLIESLQLEEHPEFDWALKGFPKDFHEPFYANYIQTPLRTLLSINLAVVEEKYRFLSKSLLAGKI